MFLQEISFGWRDFLKIGLIKPILSLKTPEIISSAEWDPSEKNLARTARLQSAAAGPPVEILWPLTCENARRCRQRAFHSSRCPSPADRVRYRRAATRRDRAPSTEQATRRPVPTHLTGTREAYCSRSPRPTRSRSPVPTNPGASRPASRRPSTPSRRPSTEHTEHTEHRAGDLQLIPSVYFPCSRGLLQLGLARVR